MLGVADGGGEMGLEAEGSASDVEIVEEIKGGAASADDDDGGIGGAVFDLGEGMEEICFGGDVDVFVDDLIGVGGGLEGGFDIGGDFVGAAVEAFEDGLFAAMEFGEEEIGEGEAATTGLLGEEGEAGLLIGGGGVMLREEEGR
jgi:hypothetical protein